MSVRRLIVNCFMISLFPYFMLVHFLNGHHIPGSRSYSDLVDTWQTLHSILRCLCYFSSIYHMGSALVYAHVTYACILQCKHTCPAIHVSLILFTSSVYTIKKWTYSRLKRELNGKHSCDCLTPWILQVRSLVKQHS